MKRTRLTAYDRISVREWDEFYEGLMNAATVDDTESASARQERIARLARDPEAFFKYYFPHYVKCPPADFHRRATRRLVGNSRWYEVRAWARELAKSTRSMMEILYLALTGQINNVLLISNSQDNAIRLLTPFMAELEFNPRIINDYGAQAKPGKWETGEFTTTGDVAFRAVGAGQSPRGTRNKAFRPDFILIDDIDTDEECRNTERIANKWKWIEEALLPTVSVSGSYRIVFNGNIIAPDCCINRAIKKAMHVSVVNIRGKDGKSSWAEKNTEEDIDRMLSIISTSAAQKEYFNNPLTEGTVFREITWGKVPSLNRFKFLVAYGDPAPSNRLTAANSLKALVLVGFVDGKYYLIAGFCDHVTNAQYVQWYAALKELVGARTVVYNYIENNTLQDPFYEQVFIPLFVEQSKVSGAIGIIPDTRKKPDKYSRIEGSLEPVNRLGQLIFNETERENPHVKRIAEQFLIFCPQMKDPAGPDAVEGAKWIIDSKIRQITDASFTFGRQRNNRKRF